MKKSLFFIIFSFSFLFLIAQFQKPQLDDNFIDVNRARSIANEKIKNFENSFVLNYEPLYLSYPDGYLYAYMFFFSKDGNVDFEGLIERIESLKKKNIEPEKLSLKDETGYIIVSARKENNVILEYSKGVPYFITNWKNLKEYFNLKDNRVLYYTGFGRFYYDLNENEILDLATYKTFQKIDYIKSDNINFKWKQVFNNQYKVSSLKATNYVADVPFVLWSYGCSPTSSSMIFSYYDSRGYGDFVDYYFTRYDDVTSSYRHNVPSAQRELSVLMDTDSVNSGGTSIYNIKTAHSNFANSIHQYSFVLGQHLLGQTADTFFYRYIKNEIDSTRPVHWAVLNYYYNGEYIGHSIVGIGYDDGGTDTFIQVHNTWDYTEPFWNLYTNVNGELSYSCVYEVKPSGGNPYRKGYLDIENKIYIKDLKGKIYLKNISDSLFSTKLYWTTDNYSSKNFIGEIFDTIGYFIPVSSGLTNISAEFYNQFSSIIATDGTYNSLNVKSYDDTSNVTIISYTFDLNKTYDMKFIDDQLWVCGGNDGIFSVDLLDTTILNINQIFSDGTDYRRMIEYDDSIMIFVSENAIFSFNRNNFSKIDSFLAGATISDVDLKNDVLFITTQTTLYLLNILPDFKFANAGTFTEGTRKYYTSTAILDTIFYLTDLLNGIYILKTSYPSSGIVKILLYPTDYNESYCDIENSTLYLAAGTSGLVKYDISDPVNPTFIFNKNIGINVNRISIVENGVAAYDNTKGYGIFSFDAFDEISHFYRQARIEKVMSDTLNKRVYVAVPSDGLLLGKYSPYLVLDEKNILKDFKFKVSRISSGLVRINYSSSNSVFGKLEIYDSSGRRIFAKNVYFGKDKKEYLLKYDFKTGVYFIRLNISGRNLTEKVVIFR